MQKRHPDIISNFSTISRYSRRYIHLRLHQAGYDLGHSQARFMMLMAHGFIGKKQDDFKVALKKDKTTVARAMAKLEEANLIKREKDPEDHRAYRIYPTAKAKTIIQHIDLIMIDLNNILISNLNVQEQKNLLKILKKMENNITSTINETQKIESYQITHKDEHLYDQ